MQLKQTSEEGFSLRAFDKQPAMKSDDVLNH